MDICDLQTFVDCLEDAVLVIDKDFRIILANAAMLRRTGRTAREILNQPCHAVLRGRPAPCDSRPFGACPAQTARATGQAARVRHDYADAGGSTHTLEILATPLANVGRISTLVVELEREITRQVELEAETAYCRRELHELEQARLQALERAITAQEDERKRIAAELHDDVAQSLAALIVGLDIAVALLDRSPALAAQQLAQLKRSAGTIVEEIDSTIAALRPALLDDLGLVPALQAYTAERLDPLGVAWEFRVNGDGCHPPPPADMVLFRVVQEAVGNIARHAQAHQVVISILPQPRGVTIEVCDDGVGFNVDEQLDPSHRQSCFGLLGMQERLEMVGGLLDVQSSPGQGTRLCIFVSWDPAGRRA